MGSKYTVEAWGKHDGCNYSDSVMWQGQSLVAGLWSLWRVKRQGFGCVKLYCR